MKKPKVELFRYVRPTPPDVESDIYPTLGVLYIDNKFFCYTLEPSWKNNKLNSCIPDGTYRLVHYRAHHFGNCLIVKGVKNRSGILIHKGNTARDTTGCIIVGGYIGFISGVCAVLNSSMAFMCLMGRLSKFNSVKLKIKTYCKKWEGYNL